MCRQKMFNIERENDCTPESQTPLISKPPPPPKYNLTNGTYTI